MYLARAADGIAALRRFASSYQAHPPGTSHDLVVVFKGYRQQADLREARAVFGEVAHKGLELEDAGFDIGAYFECAEHVSNPHMVFLNTHSEIAASGWLAALCRYGREDTIGVVGAMGSYESLNNTVEILQEVLLKCAGVGRNYDPRLAYYFDFLLQRHHPSWYAGTGKVFQPRPPKHGRASELVARSVKFIYRPWLVRRGTSLIWPGAPKFDVEQFPRFPNAHVRSNAFMVRRDRWLELAFTPLRKVDTSLFESGRDSLTARLRAAGLGAVVVGRDGKAYDIHEWPSSRTFRLGDQGNLIVHDNHTRAFGAMTQGARAAHAWLTWGDSLDEMPGDFPQPLFPLRVDGLARRPQEARVGTLSTYSRNCGVSDERKPS